ncbi:MAG: hypothetical protein BM557_05880 [Flavobacterium sp. MedPE-SWcel]|uniref:DUF4199 domain-containing protein n=1 Tax=uncultured Flavobacterium sp. TaxID=165435 RepID=UPI00090F2604|nr:DUF4199 domain-containing protein [uncultured Flavobacterium sp.]OIQ20197.1 MAG: hypothetical protein BM557_05880 [Flavobacterium sp. MedPE-SWcel]
MKKLVLTFGLISGFISVLGFLIMMLNPDSIDFENGMIYGYASMLLAFSLIFVAIKSFRDKHNEGVISFGKAFRIGLYICLIASTVYVVVWLIDYYFFLDDFWGKYIEMSKNDLIAKGTPQEEIDTMVSEVEGWKELYKNPLVAGLITYTEILPVGLLISLIAAAILKRKPKTAQTI